MVTTGEHANSDPLRRARPDAVRSTVGNVAGIIMQIVNVVLDLEAMIVGLNTFGTNGSSVGSANPVLQVQQVTAVRSLLRLLQQINDLISRGAEDCEALDRAMTRVVAGNGPADGDTGLWSTPVAERLASHASGAGAGGIGRPHSVSTVLDYFDQVGLRTDVAPPTGSASEFTAWLDASPSNQAALGLIGVYTGAVRDFRDVPGGVRGGDLVIIQPGAGATDPGTALGIVGSADQLYNNGPIRPDFGEAATVRVYRPMTTA